MPRYFFNVRDDQHLSIDDEGIEFPDVQTAVREGECGVREILAEAIKAKEKVDSRKMEVTTEDGSVAATILYTDILAETASG